MARVFLPALALAACTSSGIQPATEVTPDDSTSDRPLDSSGTDWEDDSGPDDSDPGPDDTSPTDDTGDDTGDTDDGLSDFAKCFEDVKADPSKAAPDYDQFPLTVAEHCYGTNHQDIKDIERVVFLGDSVTVGSPPTDAANWYRNLLASELAAEFGLDEPGWDWQNVNLFDGTVYSQESGDFASCAKWGARADDLMEDNDQVISCLPEDQRDKTTLVIITIGGNDLSNLTEGFIEGETHKELWEKTYEYMAQVRDAVEWIKEPGKFPNGVHVVFTNLYEFTDGTGDVTACPVAELAGFGAAVDDPELANMVVWSMEEFMHIATDTGSDMLFLLETFCGHGYNYDDPDGRCYRGKDAELWFDLTCIHPNDIGHAKIAEMFMEVVRE